MSMGLLLCQSCFDENAALYSFDQILQQQDRVLTVAQWKVLLTCDASPFYWSYPQVTAPFYSIDGQRNGPILSSVEAEQVSGNSIIEFALQNETIIPDPEYVERLQTVFVSAMTFASTFAREQRIETRLCSNGLETCLDELETCLDRNRLEKLLDAFSLLLPWMRTAGKLLIGVLLLCLVLLG
jgi:hypothetical protein